MEFHYIVYLHSPKQRRKQTLMKVESPKNPGRKAVKP